MRLFCYSVRDSAIEAFMPPFFARADGEATRMFVTAGRQGSLKDYHEHYALYKIGSFDDSLGIFEPLTSPIPLIALSDALAKEVLAKEDPLAVSGSAVVSRRIG